MYSIKQALNFGKKNQGLIYYIYYINYKYIKFDYFNKIQAEEKIWNTKSQLIQLCKTN